MPKAHVKIARLNDRIEPLMLSNTIYLRTLKWALDYNGIPSIYYNLDGYSEEAVCIEQNDNYWMVYNGERGNKYNVRKYKNVQDACLDLILRISESEEEERKIQYSFKESLKRYERVVSKKQMTINKQRIKMKVDRNLTERRIIELTSEIQKFIEHVNENPKDSSSRRQLAMMIRRRNHLLYHLKKTDIERYCSLTDGLGLNQ